MYFAVITDKIRKKYIVVKTSFIDAIESIFIRQDKGHYCRYFQTGIMDRLERIEYVKFLRQRGYKFKYRLLFDFLK